MATVVTNPLPPRQPTLATGDTDTRYFDLSADLAPISVTVASIGTISVRRVDGVTIGVTDLKALTNPTPWIGTDGYTVNWWQTANPATASDYIITVPVTTSDSRTLHYACLQYVKPDVG